MPEIHNKMQAIMTNTLEQLNIDFSNTPIIRKGVNLTYLLKITNISSISHIGLTLTFDYNTQVIRYYELHYQQ